jgi:hypothetical protein
MRDELDFRLDGFTPADTDSAYAERQLWVGDLTVLAEHHTMPDRSHSYAVAHDASVTWGVPGEPQIVAVKAVRHPGLNTFTLQTSYHATVAFAQNWLIECGCPPEGITQVGEGFMTPADELTTLIEQQIRTSGRRYDVLDSQSWDHDPCETWALARDTRAVLAPVRVFLEEADCDTHTYTMREGAFPDENTARDWLEHRSTPLPQPPESLSAAAALRTGAALTRSAGASATPKAGLDAHSAPSAGTTQRPNFWRSV